MSRSWIPATQNVSDLGLTEKPFKRLSHLSRVQFLATRALPAAQRRLQVAGFVETFRWPSLLAHLPLQLPTPDGKTLSLPVLCQQFPEENRDRRFREDYNGERRPSKQKEPIIG